MPGTPTNAPVANGPSQTTSLTALQVELRQMFQATPAHVALRHALQEIGTFLGAQYSVQHAVFGTTMLSEEWVAAGFEPSDLLRESVNNALSQALDQGNTRCLRIGRDNDLAPAILSTAIYGEDASAPCGAAGMLVPPCSRERAHELMIQCEGLFGFLALLVASEGVFAEQLQSQLGSFELELPPALIAGADHPVKLALYTVAQVRGRHGLDQVALGTVDPVRERITVRAVSGMDELRASNPGVQQIRAAMEECIDHGEVILCHGGDRPADEDPEDDFRLHSQWSRAVGSDTVATVPVRFGDQVVGVLALRHRCDGTLRRGRLAVIQKDAGSLGPLLPLTEQASRSVIRHSRDVVRHQYDRVAGSSRRQLGLAAVTALLLISWLAFGSLSYSVAVPAKVSAEQTWTLAAPQTGKLQAVHVEAGDQVVAGQLLAELDVREDALKLAEVSARIAALETEIDAARAAGELGQMAVQTARQRALRAEESLLSHRVANARLLAPATGVVLDGELRSQLGAVLAVGTPMMRVGALDPVQVELAVPESKLKYGLKGAKGRFAANAMPDRQVPVGRLTMAPMGRVEDGANVFPGRATAFSDPGQLLPGMEGVCMLDLGTRPAWWVISHHITDWLYLHFWL